MISAPRQTTTEAPSTLKVFNLLGEVVASLVDGLADAGRHSMSWDASAFPSGVYFCKLTSHGSVQAMKLVLMK
jgi:hypothetical protein